MPHTADWQLENSPQYLEPTRDPNHPKSSEQTGGQIRRCMRAGRAISLLNYQPAGNASALAAGRSASHRVCGARFATLRSVLTGSGVFETAGTCVSRARASRGGLVTGASATTGGFCGTMVGALVSRTIRSGHLRSVFILIIGLSASRLVTL
jgi:hypothetical protein